MLGHLGVNRTVVKERNRRSSTFPTPLTKVCEPLANMTWDSVEGETRIDKRMWLPKIWLEVPKSRIYRPIGEDWVKQA